MQSQIQTYLDRARIAAQKGGIAKRTPVLPVTEKLIRVMKKLSPQIAFMLEPIEDEIIFRGEVQDFEEVLGNLLENAARFAQSEVVVRLSMSNKTEAGRTFFELNVSDDGPGLSS